MPLAQQVRTNTTAEQVADSRATAHPVQATQLAPVLLMLKLDKVV
jgi:hypothetical protein